MSKQTFIQGFIKAAEEKGYNKYAFDLEHIWELAKNKAHEGYHNLQTPGHNELYDDLVYPMRDKELSHNNGSVGSSIGMLSSGAGGLGGAALGGGIGALTGNKENRGRNAAVGALLGGGIGGVAGGTAGGGMAGIYGGANQKVNDVSDLAGNIDKLKGLYIPK
jgi:hypothetical protein